MLNECFCLPGTLGHTKSLLTIWFELWVMQYEFARGWRNKISHVGAPCLHDQSPIKSLDLKSWRNFHGWQYSICVATHISWEDEVLWHDSTERRHLEACTCLTWPLPYAPFSFADFIQFPFTIIKHSYEYISFSELCESSWWIMEPKGGLRDPLNAQCLKAFLRSFCISPHRIIERLT